MTITVRTNDSAKHLLDGTGWHVDDEGHLHIRGTSGNVATFRNSYWAAVSKQVSR